MDLNLNEERFVDVYRYKSMFIEFRDINVYRFRDIPNESKASLILFHKQWMGGHFETLIKRHYWHYHHLLFFYKLHICFVFIFLSICWCSGLNFQKIDQIFSEKSYLYRFSKLRSSNHCSFIYLLFL